MSAKLGMEAKLYRNTGSYESPVWAEVENVKDLALNLEAGEALNGTSCRRNVIKQITNPRW